MAVAAGFSRESVERGGLFGWTAMRGRTVRTPEKGERLLRQLALGKSVAAACRAERIGRQTYYDWRNEEPDFAQRADDAIEEGTDYLEDKARDRAAKDSDTLLIFLLKGRRPEKYREIREERHTGKDGGPIQFAGVNIPPPTADEESP